MRIKEVIKVDTRTKVYPDLKFTDLDICFFLPPATLIPNIKTFLFLTYHFL
jgi:hypothetical protein